MTFNQCYTFVHINKIVLFGLRTSHTHGFEWPGKKALAAIRHVTMFKFELCAVLAIRANGRSLGCGLGDFLVCCVHSIAHPSPKIYQTVSAFNVIHTSIAD